MGKDTTYISVSENIFATWLLAVAFALTLDSFTRALIEKNIGKGYWLIIPVNISILINELLMPFSTSASAYCTSNSLPGPSCQYVVSFGKCPSSSTVNLYLWTFPIIQFFYLTSKPLVLHLAYVRCAAVFRPFRSLGFLWFHRILLTLRTLELSFIFVLSIFDSLKCQGTYCTPFCESVLLVYKIRESIVTIFRLYYIVCESLFYKKLFYEIRKIRNDTDTLRTLYHQTTLFTIDILQLTTICVFRTAKAAGANLPTYTYAELFSTAFTIYVMTKFVDRIPCLLDDY
ncbi:9898_t:CDS:1 [Dentiscutata erythropus]|uniref:9898_t:CDS:1 n=1 Tax=Dentiscutata erythropus TaxID=1348616 RepID=A0A9N8W8N3_9GLOM|nr:9898_t:CDS:1 [Dentiscutata erythropus]